MFDALMATTWIVALVCLLGCSKAPTGPTEEEMKTIAVEAIKKGWTPGLLTNCTVDAVSVLSTARLENGDWRVDVKHDRELQIEPPGNEKLDYLMWCGCNTKACRRTHRASYTVRRTNEGWTLVEAKDLP